MTRHDRAAFALAVVWIVAWALFAGVDPSTWTA